MRTTALALIISLAFGAWDLGLGAWGTALQAQEASSWRKVAESVPLGSKVKVQTLEGKRVSGTLMRVDETGVTIKKNTRIPEAGVVITYDAIANIERDKGGMSWAKVIGVGLVAGAGAILTVFVIALSMD